MHGDDQSVPLSGIYASSPNNDVGFRQPEGQPSKRRRLTNSNGSDTLRNSTDTPYETAQDLEETVLSRTQSDALQYLQSTERTHPEADSIDSLEYRLPAYLARAGIALADAEQMYQLFGQRMAVSVPTLYSMDFSHLPVSPILGLAVIHAILRYLPDSANVRKRVFLLLRQLLQDVMFESPAKQMAGPDPEVMQGLIIAYACCEATRRSSTDQNLDILTVKAIAESYAMKHGIGLFCDDRTSEVDFMMSIWWLWLYTASHYISIVYGCPRTLWAVAGAHHAVAIVRKSPINPRIRNLLGEVDLCLIWERLLLEPGPEEHKVDLEMQAWKTKWTETMSTPEGRQLYWHYQYTRWHLYKKFVPSTRPSLSQKGLDAAQAVLNFITAASPVAKEQYRYLTDFGFVMNLDLCVFILKAIRAGSVANGDELLAQVSEVARFMQFAGTDKYARPAIYGHALSQMCLSCTRSLQDTRSQATRATSAPEVATPSSTAKPSTSAVLMSGENTSIPSVPTPTTSAWPALSVVEDEQLMLTIDELWMLNDNMWSYSAPLIYNANGALPR